MIERLDLCSALSEGQGVPEKWAERGSRGPGLVCSEASFSPRSSPLWPPSTLCQGSWVLGGKARPCVLPGGGGHLPGEATALLLSDPDFQPHTHSMFCLVLFFFSCFVSEGFSVWLGCCCFFFWIFYFSALFFHLFLLVLFWMSMPFSVLD